MAVLKWCQTKLLTIWCLTSRPIYTPAIRWFWDPQRKPTSSFSSRKEKSVSGTTNISTWASSSQEASLGSTTSCSIFTQVSLTKSHHQYVPTTLSFTKLTRTCFWTRSAKTQMFSSTSSRSHLLNWDSTNSSQSTWDKDSLIAQRPMTS